MNVSSFHIQHVIKAYGQRLGRRSLARMKLAKGDRATSPDTIDISAEAKKKQLIHEITNGLVSRAKKHQIRGREDFEEQLFEKIGQKFKENVDIIPQKNKSAGFRFKILDKDSGEKIEELSFLDLKNIFESFYNDYATENENENR